LGSADVLFSILEPNSGIFSVPSKVLSYLCAGRPIVLSAPAENLASRIIEQSGAGQVVPAGNSAKLIQGVRTLLDNSEKRKTAGERGRKYAQTVFDIDAIGDRFEMILHRANRAAARGSNLTLGAFARQPQ
jgi:glycosyltransferase involved in cell wall biosynthesis